VWFNTAFIENNHLKVKKPEIDVAFKSKQVDAEFQLEFSFTGAKDSAMSKLKTADGKPKDKSKTLQILDNGQAKKKSSKKSKKKQPDIKENSNGNSKKAETENGSKNSPAEVITSNNNTATELDVPADTPADKRSSTNDNTNASNTNSNNNTKIFAVREDDDDEGSMEGIVIKKAFIHKEEKARVTPAATAPPTEPATAPPTEPAKSTLSDNNAKKKGER